VDITKEKSVRRWWYQIAETATAGEKNREERKCGRRGGVSHCRAEKPSKKKGGPASETTKGGGRVWRKKRSIRVFGEVVCATQKEGNHPGTPKTSGRNGRKGEKGRKKAKAWERGWGGLSSAL